MSYLDDSWLDSLINHSIFELTEEQKRNIESIKANQTRQQRTNIGDFVLQHHNRVIALRDNDLFVTVGTQIRVLNLTEFKDSWIEASQQANEQGDSISENWIHSVPYKVL
jgi:nucleoporin NUP82